MKRNKFSRGIARRKFQEHWTVICANAFSENAIWFSISIRQILGLPGCHIDSELRAIWLFCVYIEFLGAFAQVAVAASAQQLATTIATEHSAMMAPLQSKDLKFGANYMPAPMSALSDSDRKSGIVPSAPSAEVDLDMSAAGSNNMVGHGAMPMMTTAIDKHHSQPKSTISRRRSSAVCAGMIAVLVIFCCVITGLEVSRKWNWNIRGVGDLLSFRSIRSRFRVAND